MITKILQEVRSIKVAISLTQGLPKGQGQSWAKVANQSEATGTVLRIQNDEEKREIAKLSSEDIVKEIRIKEVIGAKQMLNGQVKVFFSGHETKKIMERQRDWTSKLSAIAQIANPSYQVLVHDMPFSFEPEKQEQIDKPQKANSLYIQGIGIQKAAWLKKNKLPGKKSGKIIVWFDEAQCADKAIEKGIMWGYELKATEIFWSGFRMMQCYNCQNYCHIAKNCSAQPKCGYCASEHNTRACPGKQNSRRINCSKKMPHGIRPVQLGWQQRLN
ncbi:hypothetical protein K3495_g10216 [Podosphaera aphanis]|nr:hypothetical protein K3495_g10216 [Podosphaera aphanis]